MYYDVKPPLRRKILGNGNWTQTFFSQTFRAPPGYPGKILGYPAPKVWFPWFRGTYRTFWPPPVHVEDPYPTEKYPDPKVWVWVPFSSWNMPPKSRNTLSGPVMRDTARPSQRYPPPLCAMGIWVSQHGKLCAMPPPPFLSLSPLQSMQSGGASPPTQKGYLSDTCATPHENKANRVRYPPLRYYVERVLCDMVGYLALGR